MQYNKTTSKFAFTLVELIVVITIIAILWTIAFISLQWYSAQARDSKRLSEIQNIKKSLELFSLNTWKYPLADSWVAYSFSWENLRFQWTVWDQVSTNLSRNMNEKPTDPLSEQEYIYSTTYSQTEYEILWVYESDLISSNVEAPFLGAQQLNAASQDYPKISWTYNWIYIKSPNFLFPTPTIINALHEVTDFSDNPTAIQSQIISWWDNLINWWTWALSDLTMTYAWTIDNNSSDAEKISAIETIQSFYSWTSLASTPEIADLLSKTTDEQKKNLVDYLILNSWVVVSSSGWWWTWGSSCKSILDSWWSNWNWTYTIDPEDNWTWYEVYCDMTTDWWGWTLITNVIEDDTPEELLSSLSSNFMVGTGIAEEIANVSSEIRYNCEADWNIIDIKTGSGTWIERPYIFWDWCSEGLNWHPITLPFIDLPDNNFSRDSWGSVSCCCRGGHRLDTYPIWLARSHWEINDRFYNSRDRNCAWTNDADYMRVWYR